MKFATKAIRHYSLHLKHVATLPWEIKNSNVLQIFSRYGSSQGSVATCLRWGGYCRMGFV